MKLEQVIFYCDSTETLRNSSFYNNLKAHNMDLYFFTSKSDAVPISAIHPDSSILLTDLENGKEFAKELGVPYLGKYNAQNPYDYSDAVSLFENIETLTYSYLDQQWHRASRLPVTIAETKRLTIRELTLEDIPSLYNIYQNVENTHFIPKRQLSLEEEENYHKEYIRMNYEFFGYGLWGIFNKNNKLIGHAGLQNIDTEKLVLEENIAKLPAMVELSYLIDKPFQKLGFAREAVFEICRYASEELDIEHLACFIAKNNLPSIKLAMDLSMKPYSECMYREFPCKLFLSEKLSEWIPVYEKEQKRRLAARTSWWEAQKNPVQSVYKRIYKKKRL